MCSSAYVLMLNLLTILPFIHLPFNSISASLIPTYTLRSAFRAFFGTWLFFILLIVVVVVFVRLFPKFGACLYLEQHSHCVILGTFCNKTQMMYYMHCAHVQTHSPETTIRSDMVEQQLKIFASATNPTPKHEKQGKQIANFVIC